MLVINQFLVPLASPYLYHLITHILQNIVCVQHEQRTHSGFG